MELLWAWFNQWCTLLIAPCYRGGWLDGLRVGLGVYVGSFSFRLGLGEVNHVSSLIFTRSLMQAGLGMGLL